MNSNELITEHLHLAKVIARKRMGRAPSLEQYEDAVGAGTIALCQAAQAFDPNRGVKFVTFAWVAIERAVLKHRMAQKRIFEHETRALDAPVYEEDGDSYSLLDLTNIERNELQADAEELLIQAEERARGQARLARLSPESRVRVEALLADEGQAQLGWKQISREAGVRVGSRDVPVKGPPMTRAERQKRYEQRNNRAVNDRKNAARRAKNAAARAVAA
jgi:RNA polymerase sigma factor (sigma-70 family)